MHKVMVIDDEPAILDLIEQLLKQEGYSVLRADSAQHALQILNDEIPALIMIDLVLPDMDGASLCRYLRRNPAHANTPIIFLTGGDSIYGVVEALTDAGGDDYIRKPFALRELAARVRAHLRRVTYLDSLPTIRILPHAHRVFVNEREVELTRVEFGLLEHLCQDPDRWHSTRELLLNVWDYPQGVGDAALVRNHVRNLRRKLEMQPDRPAIIQSRHRRGYIIRANIQIEPLNQQVIS